jgi:DNA repair protein RecN (Recombination protein N)
MDDRHLLSELHIENLAVIPSASLTLAPGLNVISGETGAGKTILAHAIALLLGIRADSGMIRPGEEQASVEAVFEVDDRILVELRDSVEIEPGEALAVRRRVTSDGRSRAYLGGRNTTIAVLQQLSSRLLAFSAQHEQRKLMLADRQLDILDSFAGKEFIDFRDEFNLLYDRRLELISQLEALTIDTESRDREAELLHFQLKEIEAADLSSGEDIGLEQERQQLLNAGELKEASESLSQALVAGDEGASMKDNLAGLLTRIQRLAEFDNRIEAIAGRLQDSLHELEDLGRESADYAAGIVDDDSRLKEVEERLDLINQLKRKYGATIEDILVYSETAAGKLEAINSNCDDENVQRQELTDSDNEMLSLAKKMRLIRREAAKQLETETAGHLTELAFNDCGFDVHVAGVEGEGKLTPELMNRNGADIVEFNVALNPGMPATPLKQTASGGELSRIMLAIKSAVSAHADTETLVFDEIDAGIGGETGSAVGAKLKALAANSQVICITHLPQIACFADAHFSVVKSSGSEGVTETNVTLVEGDEVVDELCRMMGSNPGDIEARAHADSLLNKAASC